MNSSVGIFRARVPNESGTTERNHPTERPPARLTQGASVLRYVALLALAGLTARGAESLTDAQLNGTANTVANGAELTIVSGGTLTANAGSVVDFKWTTLALPDSLLLKDLSLEGASAQLTNGSTFTLKTGSTFVAETGSSLALANATVTFPSTVVLTTGSQSLTGKTLLSPTFGGTVATIDKDVVLDLAAPPLGDVNYYAPLRWGTGSRYGLSGGRSIFNNVDDNVGGISYNYPALVAGDVSFAIAFESKFYNPPQGVDTEFYYAWNGPVGFTTESGGRNSRRIFQTNVSWGTQSGAPASQPMGYAQWGFDVNKFSVDNGANYNGSFLLDFTTSPNPLMTWQGAVNISNGLTVGGAIVQSNAANVNVFAGATTISASNSSYTFSSGDSAILGVEHQSGDSGVKITRGGTGGSEFLALGGASGGSLFGVATNGFFVDSVSTSVNTVRDIAFRYSANGGVSYSEALRIQPQNARVFIPLLTPSTSTTTGALTVAGGIGAAGAVNTDRLGIIHPTGDSGLKITRGGTGVSEFLALGGASGGSLFGGASNGFFIDSVSTSANSVRDIVFRSSANSGAAHTEAIRIQPRTGQVIIPFATAGTATNTGALVVGGGIGAGGTINAGNLLTTGVLRSYLTDANTYAALNTAGNTPTLTLNSNSAGNYRYIDFTYGASSTKAWRIGYFGDTASTNLNFESGGGGTVITLASNGDANLLSTTPASSTSTGALVVAGGFGLAGNQYLGGSLNLAGGGVVTGTAGSLALIAGGTNQNITLTPSGTGTLVIASTFTATGAVSTSSTTASTSTSTGALVVAGGFGLAGNQYLGGSLNLSGGGILAGSAGSLSLTAGGTDKDITLTPSGTGRVVFAGPVTFSGNQTFTTGVGLSGGGSVAGTAGSVSLTAAGTNQNITLAPSGSGLVTTPAAFRTGGALSTTATTASTNSTTGALVVAGGFGLAGDFFTAGSLNFTASGVIASGGSLSLSAGGTNQNITLNPSGSGILTTAAPFTAAGAISTSATTASTSTSTGALVVAGGFGLAGNQYLGGSLNLAGGGVLTGTAGSLALTAGGTNQTITLTPSGTGGVAVAGPLSASGPVTVSSTTNSASTSTGALVVVGGAAVQKKISLGDDLVLTPTTSTAATLRLSGTTVADTPGIWFRDGGSPTAANAALSGSSTATILNGPSGGTVNLRIANTNYLTLAPTAATLQGVPLNVTATTASISQTTGSATFGGGIGVNGRTSTKTLAVGNGAALDLILTTISVLDFPSIAANGGVQDLTVTLTGANLGDSITVVEANGSFIPAGVVLRAIVTATNTVTVRATNVTAAAIDPASAAYRITLFSF